MSTEAQVHLLVGASGTLAKLRRLGVHPVRGDLKSSDWLPKALEGARVLILSSLVALGLLLSVPGTPLLAQSDWVSLGSASAWRGYQRDVLPAGWVADSAAGTLTRVRGAGDIVSRQSFCSFELEFEWRIEARGNSGVFYWADESPSRIWHHAPEMQVLDNTAHADGRNTLTSAGSLYAVYAPDRDLTRPVGEWNTARIVARGDTLEHWLNGVRVVRAVAGDSAWRARVAASKFRAWPGFGGARCGLLGLQDHGDWVQYRAIRVRELSGR